MKISIFFFWKPVFMKIIGFSFFFGFNCDLDFMFKARMSIDFLYEIVYLTFRSTVGGDDDDEWPLGVFLLTVLHLSAA